jgi:hypothetical protein
MASRGLYVTQWGAGLDNANIDGMLAHARANYTDLYVQVGVISKWIDKQPRRNHYLDYILDNKGDLKVHAYLRGKKLWRRIHPMNTYPPEWLYCNGEEFRFDPMAQYKDTYPVQNYLPDMFRYWAAKPVDGILIDGMWYDSPSLGLGTFEEKKLALNVIMKRTRALVNKPIGVVCQSTKSDNLQDHRTWFENGWIDYISPMIPHAGLIKQFAAHPAPKIYTTFKTTGDIGPVDRAYFAYGDA